MLRRRDGVVWGGCDRQRRQLAYGYLQLVRRHAVRRHERFELHCCYFLGREYDDYVSGKCERLHRRLRYGDCDSNRTEPVCECFTFECVRLFGQLGIVYRSRDRQR
jgi:hypothetical protein